MTNVRPPRPLEQLLVASVTDGDKVDVGRLVADETPRAARDAAHLHRITPAVHRYLTRLPGAPAEWAAELRGAARMQSMRHLLAQADLATVRDVMTAVGCRWVAVKGPVIEELVWPATGMREYYDLDVVVDRARFADVLEALLASRFHQLDRNWPLLLQSRRAEIAMRAPRGISLDLHWDIAVPPGLRAAFRTDISGMLDRASKETVGTVQDVPVLDPVDTAVHLAFHAAQAGANRLMWLADVRFAVGQEGFDWDEFARRVRAMRFEVPAALVLARVERTLGTGSVPAEALAPARQVWGTLTARRDAHVPFPGLPGDEHLGGGLYVSARRSLPASAAALVRHRVGAWRAERVEVGGPPPLQRDVPDAEARRRYLTAVTRGSHP